MASTNLEASVEPSGIVCAGMIIILKTEEAQVTVRFILCDSISLLRYLELVLCE